MRNNEDRATQVPEEIEEEQAEKQAEKEADKEVKKERRKRENERKDPLDALKLDQNEFVTLPSQGRFYPEEHPLYGAEEIEVKEMTTKEEDILSNQELVEKGVAIDRVVDRLLADPVLNQEHLLSGDKDAVVIHARKSAYGPMYEVNMNCPICNQQQTIEYDLDEETEVSHGGAPEEDEDVEYHPDEKLFSVMLPETGVEVKFRLLTGRDTEEIDERNKRKKKYDLDSFNLVERMSQFIVSLNDYQKQSKIEKFVENMPAKDSKYLRKVYKQCTPSEEMKIEFYCNQCGFEDDLNVPFQAKFFWPDQ